MRLIVFSGFLYTAALTFGCSEAPPSSGQTTSPTQSPSSAPTASAATSASAAAPPADDTLTVAVAEKAPLLGELEDDEDAQDILFAGEMVRVVREIRPYHWAAKLDGTPDKREGVALEIRLSNDGASMFAFKPDLGAEVRVTSSTILCDALSKQRPFDLKNCPAILRRAQTPSGGLLAYVACSSGPCPIGVYQNGTMASITVENIVSTRYYRGTKRALLLATVRFIKDEGKQSGGGLVPIVIDGSTLSAKDPIYTDRVDARDPSKMLARHVYAKITPAEVILTGDEETKDSTGKSLSKTKISEKHSLPSLD
ncbi:MAG: hypothetical protein IPK82_02620 [Polyangiaceae bacterium]|nr:hypothetical protein [Polyangiaceae bacterium]